MNRPPLTVLAGFLLGLASLYFWALTGVPALILSFVGLRAVNMSDGKLSGARLAVAGLVMGGVGNMLGCLVAGLALGVSEALVASYVDPGLTLAVNFALFLAVLLVKPAGLFGRAAR